MNIIYNEDKTKAKWQDGDEKGNFQSIKEDEVGFYINVRSQPYYIEKKPAKLDEHDYKILYAWYNSKYFFDKEFGYNSESAEYYHYRNLCNGMPKKFFHNNRKLVF